MLARYLRTSQQPVRYAMPAQFPPDLSEAIRNYLLLSLRGANVPHLHHQSQGVLQPFYQEHPAAQGAMQSLLGQQPHPADLTVLLDMLEEHRPHMMESARLFDQQDLPHDHLLHHLLNLSRPLTGDLMSPQSPVRAFGADAFRRNPDLIPGAFNLMAGAQTSPHVAVYRLIQELARASYHPEAKHVRALYNDMLAPGRVASAPYKPHAVSELYDTANQLSVADRGGGVRAAAHRSQQEISDMLRQHVIPHLYENQP